MSYTCRDCKYWGGNNKRRINSVGESKCLKSKRLIKEKRHSCSPTCYEFEFGYGRNSR